MNNNNLDYHKVIFNIFKRFNTNSPKQRYSTIKEIIDLKLIDLGEYSEELLSLFEATMLASSEKGRKYAEKSPKFIKKNNGSFSKARTESDKNPSRFTKLGFKFPTVSSRNCKKCNCDIIEFKDPIFLLGMDCWCVPCGIELFPDDALNLKSFKKFADPK